RSAFHFSKSAFWFLPPCLLHSEIGLPKFFLVGNSITSLMVILLPSHGNTITTPKKYHYHGVVIGLPNRKIFW
ncbi:MAG: hypothetical protein MR827_07335, partial [Bacteroidales bacterium]|nr:hypothetical protein [Bacteroidales bacterium]